MFFKSLYKAINRSRHSIPVLIYHRVQEKADFMRPADMLVKDFAWHMRLVAEYFSVLTVEEVIRERDYARLPHNALCITFDDGFQENYHLVAPVLKQHKLRATFYLTSENLVEGTLTWIERLLEAARVTQRQVLDLSHFGMDVYVFHDNKHRQRSARAIIEVLKRRAGDERKLIVDYLLEQLGDVDKELFLREEHIKALLRDGMEFGGHTHSHPILANVPDDEAEREILKNKQVLEAIVGKPLAGFAYPNGVPGLDYNHRHEAMVEALGFEYAVSTEEKVFGRASNRYAIPRATPWDKNASRFFTRLALNYFD